MVCRNGLQSVIVFYKRRKNSKEVVEGTSYDIYIGQNLSEIALSWLTKNMVSLCFKYDCNVK